MGTPGRVEELVAAWVGRDHARALVPEDHAAIDATGAARAFVAERMLAGAAHADLFHGCLVLGRLLAVHGGSPTLAAATIDGALDAMADDAARAWVASARASLVEGYDAGRAERARRAAMDAWEFPRCAVPIDASTAAFAAGAPADDEDALGDWAARTALAAQRAKVRRAIVGGPDAPRRALLDALSFVGIDVVHARAAREDDASAAGAADAPKRPFRFPWLRRGSR